MDASENQPASPFSERANSITREDFAARAHFFARAAKAVHKKILRTYSLEGRSFIIPDNMLGEPIDCKNTVGNFAPLSQETLSHFTGSAQERFDAEKASILRSQYWHKTRTAAIESSCLSDVATPVIDEAANQIMQRYLDAFYVSCCVADRANSPAQGPHAAFYNEYRLRQPLVHLYKNHIVNQTEAELRALGFNAKSAHIINGVLIHRAALTYQTFIKNSELDAVILPMLGSSKNTDDNAIAQRIDKLDRYWRARRDEVGNYAANDGISKARR